jgi:hypothetical protein
MTVDEALAREIRRRAADRHLPCAVAFQIAEALDVPIGEVGDAANELGVKIVDCQLGCFGGGKKK